MRTVNFESFDYLDDLLANEKDRVDGSMLEDLIGGDGIVSDDFWLNELKSLDYDHYLSYFAGDDEEEDEDFVGTGTLSEAALDAIRASLAAKLGITVKHLAKDGPRPIGEFVEDVIDNIIVGGPPAPTADPLPARALAFGQPQLVEGRGQWDNARYFPSDADEKK